jgi:hypothetical protein
MKIYKSFLEFGEIVLAKLTLECCEVCCGSRLRKERKLPAECYSTCDKDHIEM